MPFIGRPISQTFTPTEAGTVVVLVVFDLFWDVGSAGAAPFCQQAGATSYGGVVATPRRVLQSLRVSHSFPVVAGSPVVAGLAAYTTGIARMSFRRLSLNVLFTPDRFTAPPPAPTPPPAPPPSPTPPPPPAPPEREPPPPGGMIP